MSARPSSIDQDQLVLQLKSKDPEALSLLYDHYSGALYGLISRIVDDPAVAEEVLQDALIRIWDKIAHYDASKGRLFTWMANLSRNLAIDKLRSREIKRAEKTDALETYVTSIEGLSPSYQHIDTIGLKEVLKTLREEERFILEMSYFKGYTQSEVAEAFDIPLGTVKTRLRMGLKSLREILDVK